MMILSNRRLLERARQSNDSSADFDEGQSEVPKARLSAPIKSWSGNFSANGSDSDSIESTSNRSRDPSPSASPQISSHENKMAYGINISSGDELENDLEPGSYCKSHFRKFIRQVIYPKLNRLGFFFLESFQHVISLLVAKQCPKQPSRTPSGS